MKHYREMLQTIGRESLDPTDLAWAMVSWWKYAEDPRREGEGEEIYLPMDWNEHDLATFLAKVRLIPSDAEVDDGKLYFKNGVYVTRVANLVDEYEWRFNSIPRIPKGCLR